MGQGVMSPGPAQEGAGARARRGLRRGWGKGWRSRQGGSSRAFIIGRNGQVADIVLEDSSVSRAQAALINSSAAIYLQAPK